MHGMLSRAVPAPIIPAELPYSDTLRRFITLWSDPHWTLRSRSATPSLTKDAQQRPKYESGGACVLVRRRHLAHRPPPQNHPFILEHAETTYDIVEWFATVSPDLSCPSL